MTKDSKLKPARICIDPGHGGSDPGAQGNGLVEKDLNLKIAKPLCRLLKKAGHEAYMTRIDDTHMSLSDRARYSVDQDSDLFVSIHHDASTNRNFRGACGFCHWSGDRNNPRPFPNGFDLARQISARVRHLTGVPPSYTSVGARPHWYRLGVFRGSRNAYKVTSALIECATVTSAADAEIIKAYHYIPEVAQGIYQGIQRHLDLPFETDVNDWVLVKVVNRSNGLVVAEYYMHPDGNHVDDQGKIYVLEDAE